MGGVVMRFDVDDTVIIKERPEARWRVVHSYLVTGHNKCQKYTNYVLVNISDASEVVNKLDFYLEDQFWKAPGAEYCSQFIGKTIKSIDVGSGIDQMTIKFSDGKEMDIGAEMGQGAGYLVFGDE